LIETLLFANVTQFQLEGSMLFWSRYISSFLGRCRNIIRAKIAQPHRRYSSVRLWGFGDV